MAHPLRLLVTILLLISTPAKANVVCETASNTEKVVVAGGSLTEIMYYLGLQQKIVALDVTSSYPKEAKKLPSIGYVRALSTEGVLSLDPTLVIGENDMGPENVVEQIKRTNIDLRIIPETHSAEGIKSKVLCLGTIFDLNDKTKKKRALTESSPLGTLSTYVTLSCFYVCDVSPQHRHYQKALPKPALNLAQERYHTPNLQ